MTDEYKIELFILKCAVIERDLRSVLNQFSDNPSSLADEFIQDRLDPYIKQFEIENRRNATSMARYYQIFYMLENDIRRLIADTLENAHGIDWWEKCASQSVRDEVKKNQGREEQAGITLRSDEEIDYTTFGQLGELISSNWKDFAGMLRNQPSVSRVFSALNMLRGTIAHCGVLGEDEVDRLKLAILDWFRVQEGPKK